MTVLIVGGDYLGKIPERLKELGFSQIQHLSGRKVNHIEAELPHSVDVVLVLVDYINHPLACKIKREAQRRGVKALFARRSWSHISQVLQKAC